MKWILRIIVLLGILAVPAVAAADCYHNGQRVPEGTRIGPMVCKNGQWEYQP